MIQSKAKAHNMVQSSARSARTLLMLLLWLLMGEVSAQTEDIPTGVHTQCYDSSNKLWVAGQFNLAGSSKVLNIARFDPSTSTWEAPLGIGVNVSLELIATNPNLDDERIPGLVRTIECPTTGNYIYIGGYFRYAYTYSDASAALEDGLVSMSLNQHTAVNNFFRFDTNSGVIEPLYKSASETAGVNNGFTQLNSEESFVAAITCINTACTQAYIGGRFDQAIGETTLNNIIKLDAASDWNAPTITEIGLNSVDSGSSPSACSDPVYGVNGYVLSIEMLDASVMLIGGAFLEAGCLSSSSLVRYMISDDKIECVQSGAGATCGADSSTFALCCWSVAGPIYSIDRVSKTTAVVGGDFTAIDTSGESVTGAIIVTQNDQTSQPIENAGGTVKPIALGASLAGYFNGIGRTFECTSWDSASEDYCNTGYFGYSNNVTIATLRQEALLKVVFDTYDQGEGTNRPTANTVTVVDYSGPSANQYSTDLATNATVDIRSIAQIDANYIYLGGTMELAGNIARLGLSDDAFTLLPNSVEYDTSHPGLPTGFDQCYSQSAGSNYLVTSGMGSTFCGPNGYIVPAEGVAIPCDDDYGFYCPLGATDVDCCPEGYVCKTAGEKKKCPVGYYCPMGTTEPYICTWIGWFGICDEEGLSAPVQSKSVSFTLVMTIFIMCVLPLLLSHLMGILATKKHAIAEAYMAAKTLAYAKLERRSFIVKTIDKGDTDTAERGEVSLDDEKAAVVSTVEVMKATPAGPSDAPNPEESASTNLKMEAIPPDERATIEFTDLFVSIQKSGKTKYLLKDVTGTLEAGKVCAVMGPSGCGKTTFLSAMSNRINGGKTGGTFKTNGKERPLSALQHFLGFVPQEDVMHRDLTVYQVLAYQCALRADRTLYPPGSMEQEEKVYSIMEILGLMHVKDSLIGDENRRGISGGQRKRVNIGMELMQNPKILFLDEPTSGLDSTTTVELLQYLHKYASTGLNISLVIHQPRFECLEYLDNTVLLKPTPEGGRAVFVGNMQEAVKHFASVGLPCPDRVNPTDFFLDVMSDKSARTTGGLTIEEYWQKIAPEIAKMRAAAAAEQNEALKKTDKGRFERSRRALLKKVHSISAHEKKPFLLSMNSLNVVGVQPDDLDEDDEAAGWIWNPPPLIQQIRFQLTRSLQQQYNNLSSVVANFAFLVCVGMLVGALRMQPSAEFFIVTLAIGLTSTLNGVKLFGGELAIAAREDISGISTTAYFIGKILASIPVSLTNPAAFLSVYTYISANRIFLTDYYKILVLTTYACQAIGVIISLLVSNQNSQVTAMLTSLILCCFSGSDPNIRTIETTGGLSFVISQMSYARWTYGSLVLHNTIRLSKCELSAILPVLYKLGHVDIDFSGFVTEADYEAIFKDHARPELLSLVALTFATIGLSGVLIWFQSVYGEGLEEMRYRAKGARHYLRKRINEFTKKAFGYKFFNNLEHATLHPHRHEHQNDHDLVNNKKTD